MNAKAMLHITGCRWVTTPLKGHIKLQYAIKNIIMTGKHDGDVSRGGEWLKICVSKTCTSDPSNKILDDS